MYARRRPRGGPQPCAISARSSSSRSRCQRSANFVTAADHRAEEILHAELAAVRGPAMAFSSRSARDRKGADRTHRFIVDPLDGTTNFLHGILTVRHLHRARARGRARGRTDLNPTLHEIFTAEKGKGAFLNDRRLRVAARSELADALIGTGIPHSGRPAHDLYLAELQPSWRIRGPSRLGAAALDLAWTAAGRFDGFWERDLQPWDLAADFVVLREAGGFVSDAEGGKEHAGAWQHGRRQRGDPRQAAEPLKRRRRYVERAFQGRYLLRAMGAGRPALRLLRAPACCGQLCPTRRRLEPNGRLMAAALQGKLRARNVFLACRPCSSISAVLVFLIIWPRRTQTGLVRRSFLANPGPERAHHRRARGRRRLFVLAKSCGSPRDQLGQ